MSLARPGRESPDATEPGNSERARSIAPRPVRSTYDRALDLLAIRGRSVVELRRKLVQKGEDPAVVDEVIARLLDQQLLDDAQFARQFARAKVVGAGASRRRIAMELARKGVDRQTAAAAIDDLAESEGIDVSAAIHKVAEKKWRSLAKLDEETATRRLYAFLARRGFNPDEIRSALQALKADASTL